MPAGQLADAFLQAMGKTPTTLTMAAKKGRKIQECWQMYPTVGGVGNGEMEEVPGWDLN